MMALSCSKAADTVVLGTIRTAEKDNPVVEAIAVKDGRFIYVGDKAGEWDGHIMIADEIRYWAHLQYDPSDLSRLLPEEIDGQGLENQRSRDST